MIVQNACYDYYLVFRDEYGTILSSQYLYRACDPGDACAQESLRLTNQLKQYV